MHDPHLHQQLGPYRLEQVVGRGGMGTVYRAIDRNTGEAMAVKVLSPALAAELTFRERFSAEIESLKKLRHPNIVQLFGYGEEDGQLYYSMELIDGSSLHEEMRRGRRFNWRDVTAISIDICAALKHAHDHGVIHRDLKPANLLYTKDEQIKLLDFGIAKLFGNTGITTGSVMGTADYMSPEQAEGKPVGPRSDLYSLGSVMYALLAGHPPFVGKSVPEVVNKVRFESPVPVSRLANDVPVELDHMIEQLLAKNPQKRIPTALATAHRLKAMKHALSVHEETGDALKVDDPPDGCLPSVRPDSSKPIDQETIPLHHGHSADDRDPQLAVETDDADSSTGPNHFTVVDQQREPRAAEHFPWQIIPLAVLLIAIVWAGYQGVQWASRPSSADDLYRAIINAANPQEPNSLIEVIQEMDQFIQLYDDDDRIEEVKQLQSQLELHRLQRRLEDTARRQRGRPVSPLEQTYLEIVPLLRSNPDLAAQRLQALADMYEHDDDLNAEQQQYIKLAAKQLVQLSGELERQAEEHRSMITRRIEAARELAATDSDLSRRILQGIIHLYGEKSWARDLTETAMEELRALPSETISPNANE